MPDERKEPAGSAERAEWDRQLIAIALHQDRSAFASLFAYFAPRIKTYMQRCGSSEAHAEELAQETMLAVWRKAGLFDPETAGAATWIFTIARNLRIDAYRRERRSIKTEDTDVALEFKVDEAPRPDARLMAAQTESRVRAALDSLSDEQQRVVELSFFGDVAHAEIARMLEIPLGTVKSRLRLATGRLRKLLGEL